MAGNEVEREESQDVAPQQHLVQPSVNVASPHNVDREGQTAPVLTYTQNPCDSDGQEQVMSLLGSSTPDDAENQEQLTPLLEYKQNVTSAQYLLNSKPDAASRLLRGTDDVFPRELYTLPLLHRSKQTQDGAASAREQCTLPLPPQDIPPRDPCTLPLLNEWGLSTPMGTPIPGRAIAIHNGTHTPLSGTSTPIIDCKKSLSMDSVSLTLPGPGCNFDTKSQLSMLSDASGMYPICRICQVTGDESDILISPCRCAGTLQFIHNTCLMRWLEITTKKSRKPPKCELCHYQYHRHKKFKFHHWRTPRVSRQDKVLHIIFLINLLVMIGCAIATVMCFLSDKEQINNFPRNKVELSTEEIITLSCGVLFFVSFFIAMSVQIKAKHTVYQLFVKFIMQNMEWEIDEYDKSKDSLYTVKGSPAAYV